MRIEREAQAGTLESSDVLVKVAPGDELMLDISSTVLAQFGDEIRRVASEQLDALGVTAGYVSIQDKGALEFALRARLRAAVARATDAKPQWSAR